MRNLFFALLAGLASSCSPEKADPTIPPALSFVLLDKQGSSLLTSPGTPLRVYPTTSTGQPFAQGSECAGGGCTMVRPGAATGAAAPKYAFYYSTLAAPMASQNGSKT